MSTQDILAYTWCATCINIRACLWTVLHTLECTYICYAYKQSKCKEHTSKVNALSKCKEYMHVCIHVHKHCKYVYICHFNMVKTCSEWACMYVHMYKSTCVFDRVWSIHIRTYVYVSYVCICMCMSIRSMLVCTYAYRHTCIYTYVHAMEPIKTIHSRHVHKVQTRWYHKNTDSLRMCMSIRSMLVCTYAYRHTCIYTYVHAMEPIKTIHSRHVHKVQTRWYHKNTDSLPIKICAQNVETRHAEGELDLAVAGNLEIRRIFPIQHDGIGNLHKRRGRQLCPVHAQLLAARLRAGSDAWELKDAFPLFHQRIKLLLLLIIFSSDKSDAPCWIFSKHAQNVQKHRAWRQELVVVPLATGRVAKSPVCFWFGALFWCRYVLVGMHVVIVSMQQHLWVAAHECMIFWCSTKCETYKLMDVHAHMFIHKHSQPYRYKH